MPQPRRSQSSARSAARQSTYRRRAGSPRKRRERADSASSRHSSAAASRIAPGARSTWNTAASSASDAVATTACPVPCPSVLGRALRIRSMQPSVPGVARQVLYWLPGELPARTPARQLYAANAARHLRRIDQAECAANPWTAAKSAASHFAGATRVRIPPGRRRTPLPPIEPQPRTRPVQHHRRHPPTPLPETLFARVQQHVRHRPPDLRRRALHHVMEPIPTRPNTRLQRGTAQRDSSCRSPGAGPGSARGRPESSNAPPGTRAAAHTRPASPGTPARTARSATRHIVPARAATSGQSPGTPPRSRCGTRMTVRGRPAPGRAPPRPQGAKLDICLARSPRLNATRGGFPGGLRSRERLSQITVHVHSYRPRNPGHRPLPPTEHRPFQSRRWRASPDAPPTKTRRTARTGHDSRRNLKRAMFFSGRRCPPQPISRMIRAMFCCREDAFRDRWLAPDPLPDPTTSRERFPRAVHGRGPPKHPSAGGRAVENAALRRRTPWLGRCSPRDHTRRHPDRLSGLQISALGTSPAPASRTAPAACRRAWWCRGLPIPSRRAGAGRAA